MAQHDAIALAGGVGGGEADENQSPGPWQRALGELYRNKWLILIYLFTIAVIVALSFSKSGGILFFLALSLPDVAKYLFAGPAMLYWHGKAHPPAAGFVHSWTTSPDGRQEVLRVDVSAYSRLASLFIRLSGLAPLLFILSVGIWTDKTFGILPLMLVGLFLFIAQLQHPSRDGNITLDFARGLIFIEPPAFPRWHPCHSAEPRKYSLPDVVRFESSQIIFSTTGLEMVTPSGYRDSLHTFSNPGCDSIRVRDLAFWLTAQLDARRATIPRPSQWDLDLNVLEVDLSRMELSRKHGGPYQKTSLEHLEVLKLRINESKKAGHDIGWTYALQMWIRDYRVEWRKKHWQSEWLEINNPV